MGSELDPSEGRWNSEIVRDQSILWHMYLFLFTGAKRARTAVIDASVRYSRSNVIEKFSKRVRRNGIIFSATMISGFQEKWSNLTFSSSRKSSPLLNSTLHNTNQNQFTITRHPYALRSSASINSRSLTSNPKSLYGNPKGNPMGSSLFIDRKYDDSKLNIEVCSDDIKMSNERICIFQSPTKMTTRVKGKR